MTNEKVVREIILIRHGETEFNKQSRMQGGTDSPLTEEGRTSTKKLGRSMPSWLKKIDDWYVSPYGRARETSAILRAEISKGGIELPPETVAEELREISCGAYDGKLRAELDAKVVNRVYEEGDFPFPDGESMQDVSNRAAQFIENWKEHVEDCQGGSYHYIIVSHGAFLRCLAGVLTGIGTDFVNLAPLDNTGLSRFVSRGEGRFRMKTWNEGSHRN